MVSFSTSDRTISLNIGRSLDSLALYNNYGCCAAVVVVVKNYYYYTSIASLIHKFFLDILVVEEDVLLSLLFSKSV